MEGRQMPKDGHHLSDAARGRAQTVLERAARRILEEQQMQEEVAADTDAKDVGRPEREPVTAA